MEQDMVGDMLAKRRDRAIATILRVKETDCDKFLPIEAQRRLRKVVLDEVNDFYALCSDLMATFDSPNMAVNELWLAKVDEMHRDWVHLRQNLMREKMLEVPAGEASGGSDGSIRV